MKNKFKNRKKLYKLAETLGLENKVLLISQQDKVTKKNFNSLLNNAKRFVKGILKLPLSEQSTRITNIQNLILEEAKGREANDPNGT